MSNQRAHRKPALRMALVATAGVAIAAATLGPAQAAAPTPTSLGFTHISPAFSKSPLTTSDCAIANRCRVNVWFSSGNAAVILQAGYVKGKPQAKYRTSEASKLFSATFASHATVTKKTVTQTYLQRKHQHRLKLRITTMRIPATAGNPTIYAEHIIGQDWMRVKKGTKGKFAKRIGFGDLFMERGTTPLPSRLHRRNYLLLGQEMKKLIRSGAGFKLTGPANPLG